MNNITVSMVNTRGRIVWVEENKVAGLREQGWRLIVNPKEAYYPQYDATTHKVAEDNIGNATKVLDNDDYTNRLGIVVL